MGDNKEDEADVARAADCNSSSLAPAAAAAAAAEGCACVAIASADAVSGRGLAVAVVLFASAADGGHGEISPVLDAGGSVGASPSGMSAWMTQINIEYYIHQNTEYDPMKLHGLWGASGFSKGCVKCIKNN